MRKTALAAAALMLVVPAIAQQPQQSQQVQQQISENNDRFQRAFNGGDAAAVASLYAQDATILPPGAPLQRGRQAIQGFWQQAHQSGLRDLRLETVEVEMLGDAAREIGRFSARMAQTMAAGQPVSPAPQAPRPGAADSATGSGAQGASAAAGGGTGAQVEGKYVVIWKRSGSGQGWEIDTDIWNTDR